MLFFDSQQGGVDQRERAYAKHEYLNQWDSEIYEINRQFAVYWSEGMYRPTVYVALLNSDGRVLVPREGTERMLFEHPLQPGESYLEAACRGMQDELGIQSHQFWPYTPVLITAQNMPTLRNVDRQPDELGFCGRAYAAVALKLEDASLAPVARDLRGNHRPLDTEWCRPEEAPARFVPRSGPYDRFTRYQCVEYLALGSLLALVQNFESFRPQEPRTF